MNDPVHIPKRFGFGDLNGFVDYFAQVLTLGADDFVPEDFVPPELQWTVDDVFRGLELGYQLVSARMGHIPMLVECRRLTGDAQALFIDGRYDEGQDKLSAAERLVETLVGA
jgi:hypothetical protein